MNLQTNYLGLSLANPLIAGASPLADSLDMARSLEDAGAAAVVMHSLFEEQFQMEERALERDVLSHEDSFAEALNYFPLEEDFSHGPQEYYEQIRRLKEALDIPVIASLNGSSIGGWIDCARAMEQAGADAIELNIYQIVTSPEENSEAVETRVIELTSAVAQSISVPLAVKLSPFYSSLPYLARELTAAGAAGLVIFNRFYQPDINITDLEVTPSLQLSSPNELRLRLRWLAILRSCVASASLAVTGGVHTGEDAIKALMAGADAIQMVSTLLLNGPARIGQILSTLTSHLEEHEYESLAQLRGNMSLERCPDPGSFERGNYLKVLQTWKE